MKELANKHITDNKYQIGDLVLFEIAPLCAYFSSLLKQCQVAFKVFWVLHDG